MESYATFNKPHEMLSKKMRDKVTGYAGTVTAVGIYLDGSVRAQIEAPLNAEGRAQEPQWFDLIRIEPFVQADPIGTADVPLTFSTADGHTISVVRGLVVSIT